MRCNRLWTRLDGLGYYRFSHFRGNFHEATAFCSAIGGYVVNVTSTEEYQKIVSEIRKKCKFKILKLPDNLIYLDSRRFGSVWVSSENRPEYFSQNWRTFYAVGEPNHSGRCLYLSASNGKKKSLMYFNHCLLFVYRLEMERHELPEVQKCSLPTTRLSRNRLEKCFARSFRHQQSKSR